MKKIVSLGLVCALAVSQLSCNCAFADETMAASKISTTNNDNSKNKVDEETLIKLKEDLEALTEKLKKTDSKKRKALEEKFKKVNEEKLNNLLKQLAKEKTETKQLRSDLSSLKLKLRTCFWGSLLAGIWSASAAVAAFFFPPTSFNLFGFLRDITRLAVVIAELCI